MHPTILLINPLVWTKDQWLSFGAGVLSGGAAIYVFLLTLAYVLPPLCSWYKVEDRIVSPDSRHVAYFVNFTQGALGCHGSWVIVDDAGSLLGPLVKHNVVFERDCCWGAKINWDSATQLSISYELAENHPEFIYQSKGADKGISIVYSLR